MTEKPKINTNCFIVKGLEKSLYPRCDYCNLKTHQCFGMQFNFIFAIALFLIILLLISYEAMLIKTVGLLLIIILIISAKMVEKKTSELIFARYEVEDYARTLEKKVDERTEELTHSNRMKTLFSDIMRHDLLNLVGLIKGVSGEAIEEIEKGEKPRREDFEDIGRFSRKIIEMIENARKFATLESSHDLEKEPIDIKVVVEGLIVGFEKLLAEKNITLENHVKEPSMAYINPLFEDIFQNFISNAIKYSPEGSRIKIDLTDEDSHFLFSVSDMGDGVPDQHKDEIFTRLNRLQKKGVKGTGLGLAIAKKIADLHGSRICLEDNFLETPDRNGLTQKKKKGSIFRVQVPKGP